MQGIHVADANMTRVGIYITEVFFFFTEKNPVTLFACLYFS